MPETAHEERVRRMRNYAVTMAIRTACFLALIWVRGPWMLVFAAGAIFLPYFAVVVANAVVRNRRTPSVQRPSTIVLAGSPTPHEQAQEAA